MGSHQLCCNEICSEWRRHLNKGQPVSAPGPRGLKINMGVTDSEERVNSFTEHMKSNEMGRGNILQFLP